MATNSMRLAIKRGYCPRLAGLRAPRGGTSNVMRALMVLDRGRAGRMYVRRLSRHGLECVIRHPRDLLGGFAERDVQADIAVLSLDYEEISGPQIAWMLRQRYPAMPIVMFAEELGSWEAADIHDCGVNVLMKDGQGKGVLGQWVVPLLEMLEGNRRDSKRAAQYERIVRGVLGEARAPARLLDAHRIILYENWEMQKTAGPNKGRNCHAFWDGTAVCRECIATSALEQRKRVRKSWKTPGGRRMVGQAVPVTLERGEPAAVVVYGTNGMPCGDAVHAAPRGGSEGEGQHPWECFAPHEHGSDEGAPTVACLSQQKH